MVKPEEGASLARALGPHSVVLLGPWQYYLGYCLVVARRHATELSQLSPEERHGYFEEMCRAARAVGCYTTPRSAAGEAK